MPVVKDPIQLAFLDLEKQLASLKSSTFNPSHKAAVFTANRLATCTLLEHLFELIPNPELVEEQMQAGTRTQVQYSHFRHFLPMFPELHKDVQAEIEERDRTIEALKAQVVTSLQEQLNQKQPSTVATVDIEAKSEEHNAELEKIKSFYSEQLDEAYAIIDQLKAEKERLAQQLAEGETRHAQELIAATRRETESLESDLPWSDTNKSESAAVVEPISVSETSEDTKTSEDTQSTSLTLPVLEVPKSKYKTPDLNAEQQEIVDRVEQDNPVFIAKARKDAEILKALDNAIGGIGELQEDSLNATFRTAATA